MLQDENDQDLARFELLSNGFRILLSPFDNTFENEILQKTVTNKYWSSALKYRHEFLSLFTVCCNPEKTGLPEEQVLKAKTRFNIFFDAISEFNDSSSDNRELLESFKVTATLAYKDFTATSMGDCP